MPELTAPQWEDIHARYLTGESMRKIAREYGITHGAIGQKKKSQGWDADKSTDEADNVEWYDILKEKGKRSPAVRTKIIELVSQGLSPIAAGEYCLVSSGRMSAWRREDEHFNTLLMSVGRRWHSNKLATIQKSGDWKAASKMLEHHWITKSEYRDDSDKRLHNTIKVELSFSRNDPTFIQPPIIDVDAVTVDSGGTLIVNDGALIKSPPPKKPE